MSAPLLQVRGLTKHFQIGRPSLLRRRGELLKAVDGIGFDLPRGRTLGLVGRNPLCPDAGGHWNGMVTTPFPMTAALTAMSRFGKTSPE